jgi:hypothetical protein
MGVGPPGPSADRPRRLTLPYHQPFLLNPAPLTPPAHPPDPQVWFDDPASLLPKYQIAADAGLAGVGFWNLDCLAHGSADPLEQHQTQEMWDTVRRALYPVPAAAPAS